MAMARDLFSGRPLVVMLSRLALISGLAPIIAPIVGSWMVSFMPWRGIFWGLAGYGALVVTLVLVMTVETRPRPSGPGRPGRTAERLRAGRP
ncbi:MFS transporter [Tessaracoccus coleopterorum]|uniref:MFS transporter n=1 Tax=Tessaracoccus coleopterorum TaxID=2714950 RepID=UPI0038CD95E9